MPKNTKQRIETGPVGVNTMFYCEGNPAAILVTNRTGRRRQAMMQFPTAELALEWCRRHSTTFVYSPVNLNNN